MKEHLPEPGFYFFPGMGGLHPSPAAQQAWAAKYKQGPIGVLIYHPVGVEAMAAPQLAIEFFLSFLAALVAALVLARVASALPGFLAKAGVVSMLGLIPGLDVDLSYWNWYGFPADYTLAAIADHAIGWMLMGLVLARIFQDKKSAPTS